MGNEEISITRALKELSVLDKRIIDSVGSFKVLDITQGKFKNKALHSNISIEEFNAKTKSAYQSLNDLVDRRNALKSAIVLSNASTKVIIAGSEYTVAEAIEKKTSICLKRAILDELRRQKARIDQELENSRAQLNNNLDRFIEQNLGKDKKTNAEDFNNIAKPYIEANEVKAVDPIGIQNRIEELETEIQGFESDVDVALSESNARTTINI